MSPVCATTAHPSSGLCAGYARDAASGFVQDRHMDVDWLKERKRDRKVTDAALAEALGVERSVANRVANGHVSMNARRVDAVAKLFGVSRDEMLFRAGIASEAPATAPTLPEMPDDPDLPMVGIQNIDLAYGLGATFADGAVTVDVLQFPKAWVQTITSSEAAHLTWTRGRGESMEPTIGDGDLILLDRSQRKPREQDALWALTVGDVAMIKRLRVKGDRYVILSDNPSVPPDEEPIREVNIVARVVFVGKRT